MTNLTRMVGIATFTALLGAAAPAVAQRPRPAVGLGTGFVFTRPGDVKLWGVNARIHAQQTGAIAYRAYGGLEFVRSDGGSTPVIFSAGGEVGLSPYPWAKMKSLAPNLSLGGTFLYYAAGQQPITRCRASGECVEDNNGYDVGFVFAITATAGVTVPMSDRYAFYVDFRLFIPSGIGRNGFAGDPTAAFPGGQFGVLLRR